MWFVFVIFSLVLIGCSNDGGEVPLEPVVEQQVPPPSTPPATTPPPKSTPPPKTAPPPPSQPPPSSSPVLPTGIWHGSTKREGRTVLGVVLPDGRTYLLYSVVGAPGWAGGAVIGTMQVDEGSSWTMTGALYVNREHSARATINASGTWLAKQRLLGTFQVQYDIPSPQPPLYTTDAIDLIYDTRSDTPFDLAKAAGTYLGLWIPLEEVRFELRADGTIKGLTAYSCEFTGTARAAGPVAEGEITFGGPPCQNGFATVKGILGYDDNAKQLAAVGASSDKNQLLIYIGRKQ